MQRRGKLFKGNPAKRQPDPPTKWKLWCLFQYFVFPSVDRSVARWEWFKLNRMKWCVKLIVELRKITFHDNIGKIVYRRRGRAPHKCKPLAECFGMMLSGVVRGRKVVHCRWIVCKWFACVFPQPFRYSWGRGIMLYQIVWLEQIHDSRLRRKFNFVCFERKRFDIRVRLIFEWGSIKYW